MESVKSLQAQQRSSQKKTNTGLCQNFLAFRNQGAVENYFDDFFLPRLPLQMSSTAAGLYVDKVKQVVVFSIPWIQVEGYNEIYCQKPVQVKAEACLWG